MVNPYQNNFYNPQVSYPQQFFNPYAQQQRFQQQAQEPPVQPQMAPQPMQRGLNGMVVQSVDNITADCVPMDGSAAFFPKQDLSEIYVKNWCADGTIRTLTFKPVLEPQSTNLSKNDSESVLGLSDTILGALESKFGELYERIDHLEQSMTKPMAKGRASVAKKEDSE